MTCNEVPGRNVCGDGVRAGHTFTSQTVGMVKMNGWYQTTYVPLPPKRHTHLSSTGGTGLSQQELWLDKVPWVSPTHYGVQLHCAQLQKGGIKTHTNGGLSHLWTDRPMCQHTDAHPH
uniref:Uncharacterized protein n=1 Tax=Eutreptiella gymnastica TaxID=73025 RepID=A0A7S1JGR2_9EUGL